MPFLEFSMSEQRADFVKLVESKELSMSAACLKFNITRRTGYKWLRRKQSGISLENLSKAPRSRPNQTKPEIENLIIYTRDRYKTWGGRKLYHYLVRKGNLNIPSPSTITDILHRHGKISLEASEAATPFKSFEYAKPNELWQCDFKGHFGLTTGVRCFPLQVNDDHSRYNLCLSGLENERYEGVVKEFFKVFYEYGLPLAILFDNGNPWGAKSVFGGYTKLEILLMNYDILPMHGRPNHPQTQGKAERLNRTIKNDVLKHKGPFSSFDSVQKCFDEYRKEYNYIRPHESLNYAVPADRYKKSERSLPEKISEWIYPSAYDVRKIKNGYIYLHGMRIYFSDAFVGQYLGITPSSKDSNILKIIYRNFCIARYDLHNRVVVTKKIYRVKNKDGK